MRIVVAACSVAYQGRLTAHLPEARRLLVNKVDGSVLVHDDAGGYKPLNWIRREFRPECREPAGSARDARNPLAARSTNQACAATSRTSTSSSVTASGTIDGICSLA